MLEIPVVRWGQPYESIDQQSVIHFETGEELARLHQANAGLLRMDMRKAQKARDILREFSVDDLIAKCEAAADHYLTGNLPMGTGSQTPEDFRKQQSASTGLPENMCERNMHKIAFVLKNMGDILDALTRGLPLDVLSRGYGMDTGRPVMLSYQPYSPALGMVLPSNSPGVHTLWLPVIPMQLGLVLKPGSSEPWTPYRMYEAFAAAGVPREAFCLYPGGHDLGPAVTERCGRSMIFGGQATVEKYSGDPSVQVHGPGFSKILIGEDMIDRWEDFLDIMVDSVYLNSGRSCINCSSIYAPRHGREIAEAIAERIGRIEPTGMTDPDAQLAAFTNPDVAEAMNNQIEEQLPGAEEVTAKYRDGDRLIKHDRFAFLKPTVVHCNDPEHPLANTEYMFPFVSVVDCPQDRMLKSIGYTLVGTVLTEDESWERDLVDATHIDRLNIGPVKTISLNWLQPHEGNIVEFLFRARAFQNTPPAAH